ncbi:MAG: hypothetical protein ACRD4Y_17590, partial [Candidatus Acidiferrales bacterium]
RGALGGVRLFVGQMKISLVVVEHARELRIRRDHVFRGLALLQDALRLLLVLPEIRSGDFGFEGG